MKILFLTCAIIGLSISTSIAQVYTHDFQKSFWANTNGVTNYTLKKTMDDGYVMATMLEPNNSNQQNKIVVYRTDSNYDLLWQQQYTVDLSSFGGSFRANDIIERQNGGYAIAGSLIIEGEESGGFLMQLRPNHSFDWIQIYPSNSQDPNTTPIRSINKVFEKTEGYIMTGSSVRIAYADGIVFGVDDHGAVDWSHHLYHNQYHDNNGNINSNSVLNDMIALSTDEFAIVGTVNSFTVDDADVMVVRIDGNGIISDKWVYEQTNKVYNDGQPAYLERGNSIVYNANNHTFTIAGTSVIKTEGVCVDADFKSLLTFNINANTGIINWSKAQHIDASLVLTDHFEVADMIYNPTLNEYAICGTVTNDALTKPSYTDNNGFILRLDGSGHATQLRFYGTTADDRFSTIQMGTIPKAYTIAGTKNQQGQHQAWIVESLKNINNTCQAAIKQPATTPYELEKLIGISALVQLENVASTCIEKASVPKENIICRMPDTSTGSNPGGPTLGSWTLTPSSKLYPTSTTNSLTIENKNNYSRVSIMSISGQVILSNQPIISGSNELSLPQMAKGYYYMILEKETGETEVLKFIIE